MSPQAYAKLQPDASSAASTTAGGLLMSYPLPDVSTVQIVDRIVLAAHVAVARVPEPGGSMVMVGSDLQRPPMMTAVTLPPLTIATKVD